MRNAATACLVVFLALSSPDVGWACCGEGIGPIVDPGTESNGSSGNGCASEKCKPCPPPKTGSPVFMKSGNYHYTQTDLVLDGRGPGLVVSRVFNSQEQATGPLGKAWQHSLVIQAFRTTDETGSPGAIVLLPNGSRVHYSKSGGFYQQPVGHHESLAEDDDHNLTLTWPNGDIWHFTADGWIQTIADRNGNTVLFDYDVVNGQKRPTVVRGAGGQRLTIAWNGAGRIRSITDQANRTVSYAYDQDGNLEAATNPASQDWSYSYVKSGTRLLLERVEFQGVPYASATYDTMDRVIGYMEGGQSWSVEYRPDHTIKRDAAGNAWQYFFRDDGAITKRIDPKGGTREYSYAADYKLASELEEDGARWEYTYTTNGSISTATRHVGDKTWTWTITYDQQWSYQPAKILGPAGWGGQSFRYDAKGNLAEVYRIQRDGTTEEWSYTVGRNSFGEVETVDDASGAHTEYVYDTSTGHVTRVKLPPNNALETKPEFVLGYDPAGRVNSLTDPLGRSTSAVYDNLDRMTELTLPDPGTGATGFTYHWTYPQLPADGKFAGTAADFNGAISTLIEDVWGRPLKAVDAVGHETTLDWADGLPVAITDAEGNSTTYTYNELRQLVDVLHPEGTHTVSTYTSTGRLQTRRDRKNQTTTFGYDELGRPVSRQYPEGTIGYTYDGPMISSVHDNAEGGGEKVSSYLYDVNFRLTQITNDRGVIDYSWLPGDQLGGYRVDGGAWVNYGYYPSGDLHTIQRQGDASPFEYTYLLSGARAALQMSNGSHTMYTWDNLDRLLSLTNLDPAGSLISRYSYEYDRDWSTGTLAKKGMRVAMTEDLAAGATGIEKYYFDSLYELTQADYPDGSSHQWTYDRIGNRLSSTVLVPGQDPTVRSYSYYPNGHGGNSQLLQSDGVNTYAWDANGNMQTKSGPSGTSYYTWNARNLLMGLTAANLQAGYGYDFLSRRTGKTVNSILSSYQYVGLDLVNENTGGVASEHIFGADIDEVLSARIGGAEYFYASDALGSVRQIVDVAGQLGNSYSYSVWGEVHTLFGAIPNALLFTGRDAGEDALLGYRMRTYDPSIGRFLSQDPLGFGAGDASFYRYAYGDPIDIIDPLGLMGLENLPDGALDWLADSPQWLDNALDVSANVAAGMGDTLSMGASSKVRDWLGDSGEVDKCGSLYTVGEGLGTAVGLAMGGAHLGRNAVAQMGKRGGLLTRLGRGVARLAWDDRTWGATRSTWSGAMGGLRNQGMNLHHWLVPQRWGSWNAGLNYLPISARLNAWMGYSKTWGRAAEWGLKGSIPMIESSPLGMLSGSNCDCP